ncbi:MAG TPA: acylphosphatase [bacterium]|nr:acylphosphatase [bacterium]
MRAFRAVVQGRVQGVGFRYFTKSHADTLNLKGWVRNLRDGTVELEAHGPVETLERFMHLLESGPIGSRVEKIDFQWLQEAQELETFEIRA